MNGASKEQGCGILVVDDHAISRFIALKALRAFTNEIRLVQSGFKAKSITKTWFPRIIFTDIHLPDTCGLELVQEIKSEWPQERPLPHIVVITGDGSADMMQRIAKADIAALLLKPAHVQDIRSCAEQLIRPESTVREKFVQHPSAAMDQELRALFARELTTRLPLLDSHISKLNWAPACDILHQLIASSAMCREKELERCSRVLYQAIKDHTHSRSIAQAYHAFLQAVMNTQIRLES